MIYHAKPGRVIYGATIGILLLEEYTPHVPGDITNASTFDYPVLLHVVEGLTVTRAVGKDPAAYDILRAGAQVLTKQGVQAVTSNCGFLALHQQRLADELDVPVFLSSLMQIPFIIAMLGRDRKLGILTANGKNLDASLLNMLGIELTPNLVIRGLEDQQNFSRMVLQESGAFDPVKIEHELVTVARQMITADVSIGALLLECALFPAYAAAVHDATGLPVFDFVTMIDYVHAAVVQKSYSGSL